jgi:hypothetical protein
MRKLSEILKDLRATKGTQIAVATMLSSAGLKITSQQLGSYEAGDYNPKADFYDKWKEVFGEDLRAILKESSERNVSREAIKHTSVDKATDNTEKPTKRESVYTTIVEGHTEYLLVPRSVLQETQLVSSEQIRRTWDELAEKNKELSEKNKELERKNKQIDFYQEQFAKLMENLELSPKPFKSKEV